MSDARTLVRISGIVKDYPKVASGRDRLRTLAALLFRRGEVPHFRALEGIDLEVRSGESVGLIGENGAGKSTLLKIICGVSRPTQGAVKVDGRVSALLELGSGFHPEYTGRENIYLAASLMGLSRAVVRSKLDAIVDFADIGVHIDEPIKHYSSGMVVRLGFAVVTALSPDLLITDEVLAVGDESFQKKCIAWLEQYLRNGGTLLLCSHSMYQVQTLCRKALWLHQGKVRMYGPTFDVTREYLTYHEEKRKREQPQPRSIGGSLSRITSFWTESATGERTSTFRHCDDLVLQGTAYEPDGRVPVLLFGIVRADGTPVYGAHSYDDPAFEPRVLGPTEFGFSVRLPQVALLPGKYAFRMHTLDPEGLRLIDTFEVDVLITGESRDYGFVKLEHHWGPGRALVREKASGERS